MFVFQTPYCHNLTQPNLELLSQPNSTQLRVTQPNLELVVLHSWPETFLYHLLLAGATQTLKQLI